MMAVEKKSKQLPIRVNVEVVHYLVETDKLVPLVSVATVQVFIFLSLLICFVGAIPAIILMLLYIVVSIIRIFTTNTFFHLNECGSTKDSSFTTGSQPSRDKTLQRCQRVHPPFGCYWTQAVGDVRVSSSGTGYIRRYIMSYIKYRMHRTISLVLVTKFSLPWFLFCVLIMPLTQTNMI